uniref:Uncharacterized protein n=1 Tax=Bursaphelenchus xylophilus TaxID=6326 RepID=A0A1I7RYH2_BURXY
MADKDPAFGDQLLGFGLLIVACVSFGGMFIPLRRYQCKDGFFVQWVQCAVVFCVGFVINIIRDFPPFNWIAIFGGFLYATGKITCKLGNFFEEISAQNLI